MDGNLMFQILACLWMAYKGLERLILWYKDRHDKGEREEKLELVNKIKKIEEDVTEIKQDLIKKVSYKEMKEVNEKLYEIHGKLSALAEALNHKD